MDVYFMLGQTSETALIISGIHGTELSGIEVAHWVRVKLQTRFDTKNVRPYYTTFIIPEVFPETAKIARQCKKDPSLLVCQKYDRAHQDIGREFLLEMPPKTKVFFIPTNRQFPPPGQPLSYLIQKGGPTNPDGARIKTDAQDEIMASGIPLLPRTQELLQNIEFIKPKRIAAIHAKKVPDIYEKGIDSPGIFVDPSYTYTKDECQLDPLEPSQTIEFGTNPCKFDLTVDPAFPVIGFFMLLNNKIASMIKQSLTIKSDPDLKEAQTLIVEAKKLYNNLIEIQNRDVTKDSDVKMKKLPARKAEKRRKDNYKSKFNELIDKLSKAATKLKVQPPKPLELSARSLGKQDDSLALKIAEEILKLNSTRGNGNESVKGNHLRHRPAVLHYAASAKPPQGFSLGDWAPVEVKSGTAPAGKETVPPNDPGLRPAAPIITVEVYNYPDSGAFQDGVQLVTEDCKFIDLPKKSANFNQTRCKELQAYADALITEFLEQ
jgi:hypothetical protein